MLHGAGFVSSPPYPFIAGNWYPGIIGDTLFLVASTTMTDAVTRLTPFTVREQVTITDLGARVTTVSAAGLFRLGIYAADPVTLMATGAALGSVGGLATDAAAAVSGALSASVTLYPTRLYWGAVQVDNATAVFQALHVSISPVSMVIGDSALGATTTGATTGLNCLSAAVGYATGMGDFTAVAQTPLPGNGNALVWWKAAP